MQIIFSRSYKIVFFILFFSTQVYADMININCEYEKGVITNFKKNDPNEPGKSKKIPNMPDRLLMIDFDAKMLVDEFYNNESNITWTADKIEWVTPMSLDKYKIEMSSVFNKISGKLGMSTITTGEKIYRESIIQFKCEEIKRKF